MQHDPQGILLRADSPVHTWTDVNGRTVAVKPGSTWWEFLVHKFQLDRVREIPATYSVANFLQDPNYIRTITSRTRQPSTRVDRHRIFAIRG